MSYRDPPRVPVTDALTQKALDELRRAVIELARETRSRDYTITLPSATAVTIRHGLGRPMIGYATTAPVGATATGRIVESNRTGDGMTLTATGYGASIAVGIRFW